jgi:hypothetical protein
VADEHEIVNLLLQSSLHVRLSNDTGLTNRLAVLNRRMIKMVEREEHRWKRWTGNGLVFSCGATALLGPRSSNC